MGQGTDQLAAKETATDNGNVLVSRGGKGLKLLEIGQFPVGGDVFRDLRGEGFHDREDFGSSACGNQELRKGCQKGSRKRKKKKRERESQTFW